MRQGFCTRVAVQSGLTGSVVWASQIGPGPPPVWALAPSLQSRAGNNKVDAVLFCGWGMMFKIQWLVIQPSAVTSATVANFKPSLPAPAACVCPLPLPTQTRSSQTDACCFYCCCCCCRQDRWCQTGPDRLTLHCSTRVLLLSQACCPSRLHTDSRPTPTPTQQQQGGHK